MRIGDLNGGLGGKRKKSDRHPNRASVVIYKKVFLAGGEGFYGVRVK
jgi:hypothetical protein